MLYKKYHRSYVRQFKFGVKFRHTSGTFSTKSVEIVDKEPIIYTVNHNIIVRSYYMWWKLIDCNGKLIKKDVI